LMDRGASEGMQTFAQSMLQLYQKGLITKEEALYHSDMAGEFRMAAEGHTTSTGSDSMQSVNQWL
ncbi:type IV pili twitching motility protein PilT, partial [bacterium CPR1]|nr:type IV pili twitching motility protein PilT [bacterium CPR1]